jgi:hypothetical protein
MIDVLIGFLSTFILLVLFSLIERKRVPKIGKTKYLFLLIILFSSFLISPSENLVEWVIWLMFFYTVLDDMKTKTVFVPIYIMIIVVLFFQGKSFEEFIFALITFLIFLIIARKTKETFFCVGDAYAIFALAFWLDENILISILLSVFLVSAILPIVDLIFRAKEYPYTPFLGLATIIIKENWHVYEVFAISFSVNAIFLILSIFVKISRNKRGKNKKD